MNEPQQPAAAPDHLPDQLPNRRVAVVTGSDSGIGRAIAVELASQGCDIGICWHTDQEGAEQTRREVESRGAKAAVRQLDLTQLPDASAVVDDLAEQLSGGTLDILVNCAGTGTQTLLLDMDFRTWRDVVATDLDGAFCCLQRAARRMVDRGRGGRIVNITSVHEHAPRVGAGPYCAAKAGLGGLTKVAALELAEDGITVNSVAPGEISTPMTGQEDVDPTSQERPGVPLRRPGDAREVAAVVAFLCSPEGGYVTGASWAVDGGMLEMGPMAGSHLQGDAWRRP